jgi:hypothetical protein
MLNPFDEIAERLSRIENRLIQLSENHKDNGSQAEEIIWFNLTGLRNYLPDKPAAQTVYGWVRDGLIPNHKGLKKLRFLKSDIDTWLKNGRRKTTDEIAIDVDDFLKTKKL